MAKVNHDIGRHEDRLLIFVGIQKKPNHEPACHNDSGIFWEHLRQEPVGSDTPENILGIEPSALDSIRSIGQETRYQVLRG